MPPSYDTVAQKTDDQLYYELGQALREADEIHLPPGARPSFGSIIKYTKAWLGEKTSELSEIICGREDLRTLYVAFIQDKPGARRQLVQLLGDAVCAVWIYVPCLTLAELVLRTGVDRLCPEWTQVSSEWVVIVPA